MKVETIGELIYPSGLSEEQTLAIDTCPNFNKIFDRATNRILDYSMLDGCNERGCRLRIRVLPKMEKVIIVDTCLKE